MSTVLPAPPLPEPALPEGAPQRVVKVRRDYNAWVARETMEDYALRFTPRGFRKWSEWRVAHTAFGAASFLVLEAVGATLLVQHGFVNAALAILATGLIIFLAGWPISVYAARHGVDMDLLTRGAGFGYLGSTVTSLVYASFTFIFFALEAAVMAYALELAFDIPPAWGYLLCALVVIPLVTHGVTAIGWLQVWTQPLWLLMLALPFVFVFQQYPDLVGGLMRYGGEAAAAAGQPARFDMLAFGTAMTVGIALITQMGEQVDYLRFMPEERPGHRARWWAALVLGGPGWVVLGVVKMLAGALLAYLALTLAVPADRAVDPNQMYLAAWETVFPHYGWAVAATALFVFVSQLKINVTNAYAGSLAWSNFFSRLTHSHPGRVVWMVFNTGIALVLMEMNLFQAMGQVLGLYANVAIAWMMAVVADLVVNKPLGLSPPGIEFRRAYLYDINPVGVGAMGIASALSVAAHLGAFGPMAQAFSALIALVTAFVASPLIAWATGGRYYLARPHDPGFEPPPPYASTGRYIRLHPVQGAAAEAPATRRCTVCERDYEGEDMAHCPAYQGPICSLCCTLDARCDDLCKPQARLSRQWSAVLARALPARMLPYLDSGLAHYLLLMLLIVPAVGVMCLLLYHVGLKGAGDQALALAPLLGGALVKAALLLLLVAGIVAWWMVLAHRSRAVAQEESNRQTQALEAQRLALQEQTRALQAEAESHRRTDAALQEAKRIADAANQAKSRYLTAISHELRTPLNSILGYAQLLEEAADLPLARREAVRTIRRGGDHLLSLIEGTLDIERIEGGRLRLDIRPVALAQTLADVVRLVQPEAAARGLDFVHDLDGEDGRRLPVWVRADDRRLRQILLNLLGNAVKFTRAGSVTLRVSYAREMARFEIEDTGPGLAEDELERVFEPFVRGASAGGTSGTGMGLTISRMLTVLMGGELKVQSTLGVGTCFTVRLFLPELRVAAAIPRTKPARAGYGGARRRLLVVDNEEADRRLLVEQLRPLGFEMLTASSGEMALALLQAPAAPRVDAILLDLAMPGIDGWETLRRLRASGLGRTPVAIVSANAFDRGLDNDLGIRGTDFFVKPVPRDDLLDWLGASLALRWQASAESSGAAVAPAPAEIAVYPEARQLVLLRKSVQLGHVRGVVDQLNVLARTDGAGALEPFLTRMRQLARTFRFDEMESVLRQGLQGREGAA